MSDRTGAQLLVDSLATNGVRRIFGVPGESFLAVLDALHERNDVDFINCRQEGGAAMAADAHGKLTGQPGICFVTRGPGATNASAGVHVAFQDSTPMILFIGQVARSMAEREAFQEIDYRRMFGQMAKWVGQIDDAARVPEYVHRAFATAMAGRPGPVVLALPEDMLRDPVTMPRLPGPAPAARPAPGTEEINQLAEMLAASRRPLLMVGGGGWSAAAEEQLGQFAQANDVPVCASFRCQDYLDNSHPYYCGHVGLGVDANLARRIRESDLLIALGPRLGEATTGGYTLPDAGDPDLPLVHIHADPEELGRVYYPRLAINAAPARAIAALAAMGKVRQDSNPDWARQARNDYLAFNAPLATDSRLDLGFVADHLNHVLPTDAILSNGAGNYSIWFHRHYRYGGFRSQLGPTSGSMGYALPAAVAAALQEPERTTVAITGDGCFMMTCQEFSTAVHYGLNITVLVINNTMYGTIRMHQERNYPGRVSGTDLVNPDFAAMARAMGGHGETVEKTEEFDTALMRALAYRGPSLIELKTEPHILTPTFTLD